MDPLVNLISIPAKAFVEPVGFSLTYQTPTQMTRFHPTPTPNHNQIIRYFQTEFSSRDGLILASLDTIFNLIGHTGGFLAKQTLGRFIYALLGGPGWGSGQIEYIQYRRPQAFGIGLFPEVNLNFVNMDSFTISEPTDESVQKILEYNPDGVDFISCYNPDKFHIAARLVKTGGNLLLRLPSVKFIYNAALAFQTIYLIKPVTSENLLDSVLYLVCKSRRDNIDLAPTDDSIPVDLSEWLSDRLSEVSTWQDQVRSGPDYNQFKLYTLCNLSNLQIRPNLIEGTETLDVDTIGESKFSYSSTGQMQI